MCSLSFSSLILEILSFDTIDEAKSIIYWDPYESNYKDKYIEEDLYSKLMHFKKYKSELKLINKTKSRKSTDGKIIEGDFIISILSNMIYKRFHSRFDNILPWFCYTPNEVVKYSINYIEDKSKTEQK